MEEAVSEETRAQAIEEAEVSEETETQTTEEAAETAADLEDETTEEAADLEAIEAVGTLEETKALERCTKQYALNVEMNVKFLSSLQEIDLFTAETALINKKSSS